MDAHSFFRRIGAVLTGAVLLLGGIVKLMDPVGSQLVLESYLKFLHLDYLQFAAGFLSAVFNLAECVLGAALISGVLPLLSGALAGLLMSFYTILTLILLIADPQMDCGCFGELIHLSHTQSFLKNVVLMLLWALAFFPVKHQVPPHRRRYLSFGMVVAACVVFMISSYRHLPALDLTDLRVGTELGEGRIPLLGSDDEYHDEILLSGDVLLISVYDPESLSQKELDRISELRPAARAAGFRPVLVYAGEGGSYFSDRKTLLSLNRSNGGATLITDGQVARKWTNAGLPDVEELSGCKGGDPSQLVMDSQLRGRRTVEILSALSLIALLI